MCSLDFHYGLCMCYLNNLHSDQWASLGIFLAVYADAVTSLHGKRRARRLILYTEYSSLVLANLAHVHFGHGHWHGWPIIVQVAFKSNSQSQSEKMPKSASLSQFFLSEMFLVIV